VSILGKTDRGMFLTIEGTEGVGKSTNLQFIKKIIESNGIELVVTREPGGTPLAEEIRRLLLDVRDEPFDSTAELLMIFAARAQHIREVIKPALLEGKWVLSDRFTDATFAYQGYGRGLPVKTILLLENLVQGDLRPDKTFLLDIDVELGLEGARARADLDRFEQEDLEFFERVRAGYQKRVAEFPARYAVIDASKELDHVQKQIKEMLSPLM